MPNQELIQEATPLGGEQVDASETQGSPEGDQENVQIPEQVNIDNAEVDGKAALPESEDASLETEPRRSVDKRNKELWEENKDLRSKFDQLQGQFTHATQNFQDQLSNMNNSSNQQADPWANLTPEQLSLIAVSNDEEVTQSQKARAMQEMVTRKAQEIVNPRFEKMETQNQFAQDQVSKWNQTVDEISQSGLMTDPDFNVNDKSSRIFRMANEIYTANLEDSHFKNNPANQAMALSEAKARLMQEKLSGFAATATETEVKKGKVVRQTKLEAGGGGGSVPARRSANQQVLMEKAISTGKIGDWQNLLKERLGDKLLPPKREA